jgi:hypothetical protein
MRLAFGCRTVFIHEAEAEIHRDERPPVQVRIRIAVPATARAYA